MSELKHKPNRGAYPALRRNLHPKACFNLSYIQLGDSITCVTYANILVFGNPRFHTINWLDRLNLKLKIEASISDAKKDYRFLRRLRLNSAILEHVFYREPPLDNYLFQGYITTPQARDGGSPNVPLDHIRGGLASGIISYPLI